MISHVLAQALKAKARSVRGCGKTALSAKTVGGAEAQNVFLGLSGTNLVSYAILLTWRFFPPPVKGLWTARLTPRPSQNHL
jgi:hypothetical protein